MNTQIKFLRSAAAIAAVSACAMLSAETRSDTPASAAGSTSNDPGRYSATDATPRADMNGSTKLSHRDKAFLEKAAKSGMKEVEVSQAVQAKLASPAAREFAQMMVTDHTAANEELKALAARKGVTLPADNDRKVQKWADKTKDVDNDYLDEMKDDHKDAIDLFEKAAKSEDPEIAAFAQKVLPKLQHHYSMLQSSELKMQH